MSEKTSETILQEALSEVREGFDKREGSIIYDALAPASILAYEQRMEMEVKHREGFAGTCSREMLIERAREIGMDAPYDARASVIEAKMSPADIDVPIGARFNYEKLNYHVIEKAEAGVYWLECETAGEAGNISSGKLLPIDYVEGLVSAAINKILIYGEEKQDTEEYRELYFSNVKDEARDGNVGQYELWTSSYPGIGNHKIFPLWNGVCTVKISILDSNNDVASEALIQEFQNYMDPGSTGLGNGAALIGAIVTVTTATEKVLTLSGNITLAAGYTAADGLEDMIKEYLHQLAYKKKLVSYMAVGALILSCPSVENLSGLRINGGTADIALGEEEIAVYGSGSWVIA